MAKLHEILAVEPERERAAKKITQEAIKTLSDKHAMFLGSERSWRMFDAGDEHEAPPTEYQELATTVSDKLDWVADAVVRYYDTNLQKESTNQTAVADLVVGGKTLGEKLPATFLLGLETKLTKLRPLYEAIPVLPPSMEWRDAPELGKGVRQSVHPEKKYKTSKTFQHKVLYDATAEHPAQIERWEETVNVGESTREVWSGMLTTAEKAAMLQRLDELLQAVKKARQRANNVDIVKKRIGSALFGFIHHG